MPIKLKDSVKGLVISKNILGLGSVTFDTNTAPTEHYQNFFNIGFEEMFDVITEEETPEENSPLDKAEGETKSYTNKKKKK